ncbi:protein piccolo-like [Penaeus monodon]|uniref:protein piccolo-like n=1 Tax=Penaeus monodon TaxID=6687 RepID=UPI0018A7D7A0|nr:protein piccolo-like [Penaeus monodon]
MVFVLMTVCGLVLLVLNVLIIACIFRRRRRRRLRASSRTRAKSSEAPAAREEEEDGFVPLKTRTPSGSAQCQGECRDGAEDCEHTSLMEQAAPSSSSARASHHQSAGSSLGKTPPREDASLPQNGGVPSKKSPARERRRKGRSTQRDISPDVRGEEKTCAAPSVPLPTPPAALYGSLDAAAHVLPFAAPRHVHSHTHSCIIHSPQEQSPHLHAPMFIPSVYDGRDFAQTLPGRNYVCRDHQRHQYQGHGPQDRHPECQGQSPKAYHQGLHQPYQGEYQAHPMQYQEQHVTYQGHKKHTSGNARRSAKPTNHSRTRSSSKFTWTTVLRVRGPVFLRTSQLPNRRTCILADWEARTARSPEDPPCQYPAEGDTGTMLTEEDQTPSFLETLQRPPEAFADPTSFDHPVYFLPQHPEGLTHGPPLAPPALSPKDGRHGLPPLPLDACPSRPLPPSCQHTPPPPDQDRPSSSSRSHSRPPPPSPGYRRPTPPSPRGPRRPSPPSPRTPTPRRPSPKARRPQQPPDSPSRPPPSPAPGQARATTPCGPPAPSRPAP